MNRLYCGDCLEIMEKLIEPETVDLIYLDPPFFTNRNYEVIWGDEAEVRSFDDRWEGGVEVYADWMAERLRACHRVLKATGSLYLHCDWHASHYLKIRLDEIFGHRQFRNEIIWDYSFRLMDLPKFFNRKHDVILFYAKSNTNYFKMPKTKWTKDDLIASRKQKIHVDENGVEWIWMPGGRGHSKSKLRRVDEILAGGKAISDIWQMPIISSSSKERLGYPTQKPLARISHRTNR